MEYDKNLQAHQEELFRRFLKVVHPADSSRASRSECASPSCNVVLSDSPECTHIRYTRNMYYCSVQHAWDRMQNNLSTIVGSYKRKTGEDMLDDF